MKNYYDPNIDIPADAYPWTVGHRLKKSARRHLSFDKAISYYHKLKHCKTRYKFQEIPFSICASRTLQKCAPTLIASVTDDNPMFKALRKAQP